MVGPLRTFSVWMSFVLLFLYGSYRKYGGASTVDPQLSIPEAELGYVEPVDAWEPQASTPAWLDTVVILVIAVALIAAAIVWLRARQQTQQNSIFDLRKNKATVVRPGDEKTRFADVAGAAEAKERLTDVVDFLRAPDRWARSGVRPPRGVLLEGPPGCGKTLLARAVAGEAGVPVHVISASEFVEMFVGVGAARMRDLFETAKKTAPCVVFIDEFDAVGRRRGAGIGMAHEEREQTLNQLLVALDGFETGGKVVVIAATNRVDLLDGALLRPGRFDVILRMTPLTADERLDALRIHLRGRKVLDNVDLPALAGRIAGLTGAAIEHLCNESAMHALRRTRGAGPGVDPLITPADLERVLEGRARAGRRFDAVDGALLDSASQLAQPDGAARVCATLSDGTEVTGEIVWVDASFLKVNTEAGPVVLAKRHVRTLRALTGTAELVSAPAVDPWANRVTGTA